VQLTPSRTRRIRRCPGSPASAGGQRVYVIPKGDLVVGINCGNYGRSCRDQNIVGVRLVTELVLPTLA
jgi:hypothetical protein